MKGKLLASLLLVLVWVLVLMGGQGGFAASPCTVTLDPGDDIQAAINAANPGDVICLNPGLYTPSATIVINKPLTLQGPRAGVDPRPSFGSTRTPGDASGEAIIDGAPYNLYNIILVDADDVVIDGLEVRSGRGDMIYQGSPHSGATVRYCIIHDGWGDEGVQLKKATNAILEYNYVFEIADAGDGLNIADNSSGGIIRYNEVAGIHGENAAIYIYGATDMQILCNLVRDSGYGGNDGIKVGAKNGGDATKQGVLVKGNVVHNITQDGISVYMSGVTVEENEIYNCRSENGAIYVAYGVSDVTIRNNKVYDNTLNTRKWDNPGAIMIGTAVNAATVYVNANNIYGNWPYGVTNKAAATLDATGNWWGAADGPSGEGPGSGDAVSTNVSFANWLAQPQIITDPCVPLDDQGPVTSNVTAAPEPVQVGNNVAVMANVDDSATGGSSIVSAEYSLDSGSTWAPMAAQDGAFDEVTEDVLASFTAPGTAGIYELCVRGTDAAGNVGEPQCITFVVYDPAGGFVTGGGWIDSPAGAYMPNPAAPFTPTGKATFGFVSKYQKGASVPSGNTQFQFKAAGLNFHSTSYEWLVVTGSNYARYKGEGTINGAVAPNGAPYKLMLWAGDGTGPNGEDTFRLKIWYEEDGSEVVVYDNGMDQAIGGGEIKVHKAK